MSNKIENAPALEIDKVLYAREPIKPHVVRERRIVWNLMKHLKEAGFSPVKVWDGGENIITTTPKAAMEVIFNLDDAVLTVKKEGSGPRSIFLVLGNDFDVVSDWTYTDSDSDGFNRAMEKFNPEAYA